MLPEIASALIGGAAVLGSGAIGAGSAAAANRRAYKWSKKYFDYQNQYNLEHYSPAANMERYRQAGINPHEVSGSAGSGLSMQGSMDVPQYQNPVDPIANSIPAAVKQAFDMYQAKKNLDNQSELVKSQVERNTAEASKTNYQVANILPFTSQFEKNRRNIPLYQMSAYRLKNQLMMQEISMFSMQKQKYQLALDLLELQKKYQENYYMYRNDSVKYDSQIKQHNAAITKLDLNNYQQYGLRPQDPWYLRVGTNAVDSAGSGLPPGKAFRKWWNDPSWINFRDIFF